jgi:hypothetical protein
MPAPPPSQPETLTLAQKYRPNRPLLLTGGVLLLGSYVPTAIATGVSHTDRSLYIPVVGPWMHLVSRHPGEATGDTVLIWTSGIAQGLGALVTTASFFIPEKVPAATITAGNMKINIAPTTLGRGAPAIGAVGIF